MKEVLLSLLITVLFLQACETSQNQPEGSPNLGTESLTSLSDYREARDELVSTDFNRTQFAKISLTQEEKKLDELLVNLRRKMIGEYKASHDFPPANHFFRSKSHIESTELFRFFQNMPKGGLLHLHPPAAGDANWIAEKVLTEPHCYVSWQGFSDEYIKGEIRFFADGTAPAGFELARELNQRVPGLRDSLVHFLTFDDWIDRPGMDIWNQFEARFKRLTGFVFYKPMIKPYYLHALGLLAKDGIQHVEFRKTFLFPPYDLEHEIGYYTADSSIKWFQEVADTMAEREPGFSLNLIFTSLRFFDSETIRSELIKAFRLKQKYPNFIRGFDLVAEEDAGRSTQSFLDVWLDIDSLEKEYGVSMPLYMHGGESDWTSLDNLYDLSLLPVKRIGHGFNLIRFPAVLDKIIEKDICLEISPLSNQILDYIGDLRIHPGSYCLARGVPIAISSDDPLIFNYEGLSYDFWSIFLAWELDLASLKQLVKNSLTYSSLPKEKKQASLELWADKWDTFVLEAQAILSN